MKITNKFGLPGAIVEAVKNDTYDAGKSDISVTGLCSPPRQKALMKAHTGELVEDASDRIWALMGQAVHAILERAEPSAMVENRLFMDCLGWTISGQFDRITLRGKTLQDYKFCSVWEDIYGLKPEKTEQLNLLLELLEYNGFWSISNLEIVAIFRDWSKTKAKFDKKYPQSQVKRIKVQVWDKDKRKAFMEKRVRAHQNALVSLPECTPDERWATPDKWAHMKEGRKSAIKLYTSADDVEKAVENGPAGSYVEYRPGTSRRCEDYCAVSAFCEQYQKMKKLAES